VKSEDDLSNEQNRSDFRAISDFDPKMQQNKTMFFENVGQDLLKLGFMIRDVMTSDEVVQGESAIVRDIGN
jgi:hypothetical protein